jgi:hypothetical protein
MNHPELKFGAIILMGILVVMAACTNDENPVTPLQNGLPGTWEMQRFTIVTEDETVVMEKQEITELGIMWSLKFKIDKSFKYVSNLTGKTTVEQGFWSTTADTLQLTFLNGGSQQKLYYEQHDNDLTLKWQGIENDILQENIAELHRPVDE